MRVPTGVGMTAIGVAAIRAHESRRDDRLFDDPLATRFLAAAGWTAPTAAEIEPRRARWRMLLVASIPIRTRFLDDYLRAATDAGCRQVVLLGAGLDTRAYRLAWPDGTRLFEVDLPDMVGFKNAVLSDVTPSCDRVPVIADLTDDWPTALKTAGFDPTAPTAWVAEGLLVYLTEEQNESLLTDIAALSVPGSHLALTSLDPGRLDAIRERHADGPTHSVVRLWRSSAPEDPVAWLARYGWRATAYDPAERAASYGRPNLFDAFENPPSSRGLVSAVRI